MAGFADTGTQELHTEFHGRRESLHDPSVCHDVAGKTASVCLMTQSFVVKLRGVSFENAGGAARQTLVARLKRGEALQLKAEPENPHDRFAVSVWSQGSLIGYLPSDARDSSSILRGEKVSALVENVYGGPTLWSRIFGSERFYGVAVRVSKEEPDWSFVNACREKCKSAEQQVAAATAAEKAGGTNDAIALYKSALDEIVALNRSDPVAAAHRQVSAPINRLTMLLQKEGRIAEAQQAIANWRSAIDPIGLTKTDVEALTKREQRLAVKPTVRS